MAESNQTPKPAVLSTATGTETIAHSRWLRDELLDGSRADDATKRETVGALREERLERQRHERQRRSAPTVDSDAAALGGGDDAVHEQPDRQEDRADPLRRAPDPR